MIQMNKQILIAAAFALTLAGCGGSSGGGDNGGGGGGGGGTTNIPGVLGITGATATGAKVADVLTAELVDVNGATGTVAYQWFTAGNPNVAIAGATSETYTVVGTDLGTQIVVSATYTDDLGNAEEVFSASTALITGTNNVATVELTSSNAVVTDPVSAVEGDTLTATVTDADGATGAITYEWFADGVAIAGQAAATLVIADVIADVVITEISVNATFTDDLGNAEDVTSGTTDYVEATSINNPAFVRVIGGPLEGNTLEVDVLDFDGTDAATIAYEWFSDGASVATTETYDVAASDIGSAITVNVTYTDDAANAEDETSEETAPVSATASATNQVVQISDTNLGGNSTSETGELRYNFTDAQQGSISFSFLKNEAYRLENGEFNARRTIQDAYFTLYGTSGSNGDALIDLRIQDDNFAVRGRDDIVIEVPFTPDTWHNVELSWDVTAAEQITLTIDGVVITGGAFTSGSNAISNVENGVRRAQWRFSDNSRTAVGSYFVDDILMFVDAAGTVVELDEDFEAYTVGDLLNGSAVDGPDPDIYAADSMEAEVALLEGPGAVIVPPATTQVAEITDTIFETVNNSSNDGDTGEVRHILGTPLLQGKLTARIKKEVAAAFVVPAGSVDGLPTEDDGNKDAYIALYGPDVGSNQFVDLRIQADQFLVRGTDGGPVNGDRGYPPETPVVAAFVPDQWYDIEINWDVTDPGAEVQILIDGVDIGGGFFLSGAVDDDDINTGIQTFFAAGVTAVQFRFGDNDSTVPDGSYFVDEWEIFSDIAGNNSVFSDDFEAPAWTVGDSIDPDDADAVAADEYNNNTVDAVISEIAAD